MIRLLLCCALASLCIANRADAQNATPATRPADLSIVGSTHSDGALITLSLTDLKGLLEKRPLEPPAPPVDYLFSSASYQVSLEGAHATVAASAEITVLSETWALVPIGRSDQGLVSASIDGAPAQLVVRDGRLLVLLDGKGRKKLSLSMMRDVVSEVAGYKLTVPLIDSPLVNLAATLPTVNLDIRLPGGTGVKSSEKNNATEVTATYRGGMEAVMSWHARPPAAAAADARPSMEIQTLLTLNQGRLRTHTLFRLQAGRAPIADLQLKVDPIANIVAVSGKDLAQWKEEAGEKSKSLVLRFDPPLEEDHDIEVVTERELPPDPGDIEIPLISAPSAARLHGLVGIEVGDSMRAIPLPHQSDRIDVEQLPKSIWQSARSPILFGFKYGVAEASLTLSISRNKPVEVLLAMSDYCEASTTYTPDGKCISKMMFVVRNNLKQFMTLKMPEGGVLWSAFVDDSPVTPSRSEGGEILIPLRKSHEVDENDEESYRALREKRRSEPPRGQRIMQDRQLRAKQLEPDAPPADLKPYDVEIVFVIPSAKFADRGQLATALPKVDIPIGHLAWAIFLPHELRVVDAAGNLAEVDSFSLPFRHFGEAEWERQSGREEMKKEAMQQQAQAAQALDAARSAEASKAIGVLPVRIETPIVGDIHRFEKFLTVDEAPAELLDYARKP